MCFLQSFFVRVCRYINTLQIHYIYICVSRIRPVKDLEICVTRVIEKVLIFVTFVFSKIHFCLSWYIYTYIYIYIYIYKPIAYIYKSSVYVWTKTIKLKTYFLESNFCYLHNFFIAYKANGKNDCKLKVSNKIYKLPKK